ncbi:MAG: NERD domain-containing protein [Solirubrobacterales bacterium]|nr:NERD domain-containing protein [Solirubrobacterales bacterium]
MRHGLRWPGGGDIDSVAIAPNGVGFAIETKTRIYDERQLDRVREQAGWLGRRRRRSCRHGALPVLCVVRAAGSARYERGVLVVSIDRLVPVLREVANGAERSQATPLHECQSGSATSVKIQRRAGERASRRGWSGLLGAFVELGDRSRQPADRLLLDLHESRWLHVQAR